jgi:hypothetical protein
LESHAFTTSESVGGTWSSVGYCFKSIDTVGRGGAPGIGDWVPAGNVLLSATGVIESEGSPPVAPAAAV